MVLVFLVLAAIVGALLVRTTITNHPAAAVCSGQNTKVSSLTSQQQVVRDRGHYTVQSANKPYSVQAMGVCDRFEVRAGDSWANDKTKDGHPTRNRAELAGPPVSYGQYWWGSFAFRIPASSALPRRELALGQFHSSPDASDYQSRSPVLAFRLFHDGHYGITTESDPNAASTAHPKMVKTYSEPSLQRDHWYHIVYRVRFERTGVGSLLVYIDGKRVINNAVPLGFNDVRPPHWKYGVYRLLSDNTFVVYYANMELTTASLQDRVAHPLPIPGP